LTIKIDQLMSPMVTISNNSLGCVIVVETPNQYSVSMKCAHLISLLMCLIVLILEAS